MQQSHHTTLNEIPALAQSIALELKGGEIFALIGDLGAGKTTFTQALAKQLKIKHRVTSPTFVVMNCFPFKLPGSNKQATFYHLDLYRTEGFREVDALGITELWNRKDTVTVIEWADKIIRHLPENTRYIYFK